MKSQEGAAMTRMSWLLVLLVSLPAVSTTAEIVNGVNFVVMADDEELARRVLHEAEIARQHAALACLAETLPAGEGRTVINVMVSDYRERAFFWPKDRPGRTFHNIHLTTSRDRVAAHALWHEIVHLVLEVRFGGELPLWADEGFASMQDDEGRKQDRAELARRWMHRGNWPDLKTVFNATTFGSADVEHYAAANSVTRFLLTRGDAPAVLAFACDGKRLGWDAAARKHYRVTLAQLQQQWQHWVQQPMLASS
jgi:hypothetical protein